MKTACIILPTYNEAKTITSVIAKIQATAKQIQGWDISLLVVDDHSPDHTAQLIRKLQHSIPHLYLLEGEKEGLGKAYIRGFLYVLTRLPDTQVIFEMDADGSHNPAYIKDFLHAAEEGYDFIIGARYIKAGSCPDWKWYRKMLSFWGNQYIRIIGGMSAVHDCTSGYRCISVPLLRRIQLSKLLTKGYAFQMSLLHQAIKIGASIKEIPIVFTDRKNGISKLGKDDIIECLTTATFLRFRSY